MDPVHKLAAGIMFYKENKDVPEDYIKAIRYLDAALEFGKIEANYYLGMIFRTNERACRPRRQQSSFSRKDHRKSTMHP